MRWRPIHIPGIPDYPLRRLRTDRYWWNQSATCTHAVMPSREVVAGVELVRDIDTDDVVALLKKSVLVVNIEESA